MARQTAVQWLVEQIKSDQNQKSLSASEWMQVINQAKQMEREQMEDAYDKGKTYDCMAPDDSFDAYYNKYYKKEGDYDDYLDKLKYLKDL